MFDNIAPVRISRRRKIFFAASGVVHGAAVAALIVTAMWRVDKLTHEKEHVQVSIMPPPPPGNSGGGVKPTASKPDVPRPPRRIRVTTPVQPVPHVAVSVEPTEPADHVGDGGGGDGKGSGDETIGSGCTDALGCGAAISAPPEPPKPCSDPSRAADPDCAPKTPPRPPIVVIGQLRLSGETNVQPPDDVKVRMGREGKSKLHGAFRVCLDASGAVASSQLITSTGYETYDQRLIETMAGWTYRPYSVNGTPIAACGAVAFVFTMR
jgi:hypothetical protein